MTVIDERLNQDELDTILAIARNKQSGRITEYEVKALVSTYQDHTDLLRALLAEPDGVDLVRRVTQRVLDAREAAR